MSAVLWVAPLLLLPLVGAPLLVRPAFRRFGAGAAIAIAGAAGATVLSFVMTLFALAGRRWSIFELAVLATLLAWVFSHLPAFGVPGMPPLAADGRGLVARLSALVSAAAVGAAAIAAGLGSATSPDLFFFWGTKAQQFAIAQGIDAGYLAAPFHEFLHPYYPPLVTNLGAFAAMAAGRFSWDGATATFPILLGGLAIALPGLLPGERGRAGAAAALAVSALALLGIRAGVAGNGDAPLVFFETLAMALLLRPDAAEPSVQWLAGLLLAGAATTKVEGLPWAIAAAALFVALRFEARRPSAAARLLAPAVLALGAWFAFGAARRVFAEYSEYGPFASLHPEHLGRIVSSAAAALAGPAHGLPYLVPLVCLLAAGRPSRTAWVPIGTAAALAAFLLFAYLHYAGDPALWIGWSAARVLMPAAPLFALALAAPAPPPENR